MKHEKAALNCSPHGPSAIPPRHCCQLKYLEKLLQKTYRTIPVDLSRLLVESRLGRLRSFFRLLLNGLWDLVRFGAGSSYTSALQIDPSPASLTLALVNRLLERILIKNTLSHVGLHRKRLESTWLCNILLSIRSSVRKVVFERNVEVCDSTKDDSCETSGNNQWVTGFRWGRLLRVGTGRLDSSAGDTSKRSESLPDHGDVCGVFARMFVKARNEPSIE